MILSHLWLTSSIFYILVQVAVFEDSVPFHETGDWIPIVASTTEPSYRESKSSDRILNIGVGGKKFNEEEKYPVPKTFIANKKPERNIHIKRSSNQRQRIRLDQPYIFEHILQPPTKQHLKGFPKKNSYTKSFNPQPNLQYNFNIPQSSHIVNQEAYQQYPLPPFYKPNNLQVGPSIPNYSPQSPPLGIQYQHPNPIHQVYLTNNSVFQHPSTVLTNQGLFETTRNQGVNQNVKSPTQVPSEQKDTVQLLYVPLEQLRKEQGFDSGILDNAFKSLQQQGLVAQSPESDLYLKQSEAELHTPKPSSKQQEENQQKFAIQHSQLNTEREEHIGPQYQSLRNTHSQKQVEQPRYYELVSKNHGEILLQNNPKTIEVSNKQDYQVQAEKQKIIELTQPQFISNHGIQYSSPIEYQERRIPKNQFNGTNIQDAEDSSVKKEPHVEQTLVVRNQVSQPFSVEAPNLRESYTVRGQYRKPALTNHFQNNDPKTDFQSIRKDVLQHNSQVNKSQKQNQQDESTNFHGKISPSTHKRKPHQPPLAVYMEGNQPGDVEAVLELLKNAESIAVQDQIGPNSPQVFIGPSNLNVPNGFTKFPLPYLSNLDNNRIQREAQQFPFFVAPINYKEPEGYSKIPLPSPHVGSVVVSQLKRKPISYPNDNFQGSNSPVMIANYKFLNPDAQSFVDNSHFDQNWNAYSLENGNLRGNTNRHLKEQTLFQQINGFSDFTYPQNLYGTNGFGGEQGTVSSTPQSINDNDQYSEVREELEHTTRIVQQETTEKVVPLHNRQRSRGDKLRSSKIGGNILKETNTLREKEEEDGRSDIIQNIRTPEVPSTNTVRYSEIETSSQHPLTQEYLNRFSSNNNFNFNYVSSTPGYATPTKISAQELPANIRKLNPVSNQVNEHIRNQQAVEPHFDKEIQSLQNSEQKVIPPQEGLRVHGYNQYEQYELPTQLTDITPDLPGLINELEQQNQNTTLKYEAVTPTSTTTTQYTIRMTEPTTTRSTTRLIRGRGKSRFNTRTTTSSPYRRTSVGRRRPSKTNDESSTKAPSQTERTRTRTRLPSALTERFADGSIESTSSAKELLQPVTRTFNIPQNQRNNLVDYQSSLPNMKTSLREYVEEPKTETIRTVELYQSQRVTPAEELASNKQESSFRHIPVILSDKSELTKPGSIQKLPEVERSTRKRVRVRGRPKNKYSSTAISPEYTPQPEKEETEFYGFIRQPNIPDTTDVRNHNRKEGENIHIYAPTQKSPVYNQRINEPVGPSTPRPNEGAPRFVGELRTKYASPSRDANIQLPGTSSRGRVRGRVKIPGRTHESRVRNSDKTTKRNSGQESENEGTENYPASFQKRLQASTTPRNSEFKITISADDETDQIPNSSINIPERSTTDDPHNFGVQQESSTNLKSKLEISSFKGDANDQNAEKEGFALDQFDTAESQNYKSLFNNLNSLYEEKDFNSKEVEMNSSKVVLNPSEPRKTDVIETTTSMNISENEEITTPAISGLQNTSRDDHHFTILESVRDTIENETIPPIDSTTPNSILATATGGFIEGSDNMSSEESTETIPSTSATTDESKSITPAEGEMEETKIPLDLLLQQTSTSTEVSHETEICYKGRCVKSKNKKLRKRIFRKKVDDTNTSIV